MLNVAGNVGEWVFDWKRFGYGGLSTTDPAGPACDDAELPNRRVFRGIESARTARSLENITRNEALESFRSAGIGFRCGRTLGADGGVCGVAMPDVGPACRPGADLRTGAEGQEVVPRCAAPDFVHVEGGDVGECQLVQDGGGFLRDGSGDCRLGVQSSCASDTRIGCQSFVLTRLELVAPLDAGVKASLNSIFQSMLVSGGGAAIVALSVPEGFDLSNPINREWAVGLGTAKVDVGSALAWTGQGRPGMCEQRAVASLLVGTEQGNQSIVPVCPTASAVDLAFDGAPMRLVSSAVALTGTFDRAARTLSGNLVLFGSGLDLASCVVGRTAFDVLLDAAGDVEFLDLCA